MAQKTNTIDIVPEDRPSRFVLTGGYYLKVSAPVKSGSIVYIVRFNYHSGLNDEIDEVEYGKENFDGVVAFVDGYMRCNSFTSLRLHLNGICENIGRWDLPEEPELILTRISVIQMALKSLICD